MRLDYPEVALRVPTILLPNEDIALDTWAVIACDQYTSEPGYWDGVYQHVGQEPSTLHLVFPEVYLETADSNETIGSINERMDAYLQEGVLRELPPGFVRVERTLACGAVRKGLMVALDLEQYDYRDGAQELVRTTEGTVLGRLPPRIQVREQAPLEVPHIMVLIDDPQHTVIEPLFKAEQTPLYDGELMLGGGRVRGYHVGDEASIEKFVGNLAALGGGESPMLYAMGDGNHSFATAKAVWERIKEEAEDREAIMQHPARYGLVELVNIHDEGLEFEPIHRAVFGVDTQELMAAAAAFFAAEEFSWGYCEDGEESVEAAGTGHAIAFFSHGRRGWLRIGDPVSHLLVASLQAFIDDFIEGYPLAKVDYIHGETALEKLVSEPHCTGFLLPGMDKRELFQTIAADGALPRKTFSLGEAEDKRYYVECRRIVP
ncbi:MAG: hypothetical protein ACI906_005077 [Candidatus Latescibacterota bacterium]|jgi:hypothetical protein